MSLPSFPASIPALRVKGSLSSFLLLTSLAGCASGPAELPEPRPIIIRSGARLSTEKDRMTEVDRWYRAQREVIEEDPSFLIETVGRDTPAYPWESLVIEGDTARIGVEIQQAPDADEAYVIYAHFHLMDAMGRLEQFLPGGDVLEGFELERAILSRVADVWLYGRTIFDVPAYEPLEELVFAKEAGFLDALILTARGEEFEEERAAWLREDPEGLEGYRSWFMEIFGREPPGMREGA